MVSGRKCTPCRIQTATDTFRKMFWETVAAVLLILTSLPIWFFLAALWGMIRGGFAFFVALGAWLEQDPLDWSAIWVPAVEGILQAVMAAWSIPSGIWRWAKFEHPWWAFFIALALMILRSGMRGR